ncbi:argininosuccinate lyase [Fusibacter sp. 3D3]|uniref:argininosuccinate lyase n=1 Tax=Fusibacter sp. 3D3 TaxID=1048380 RepID=UPI000853946F|nr:argininosuccinate lyase [Fusibacter sp. 3D3]GAU76653.1 argininosuccinate lyase [Fusibacter sp. 3D3]
MANLWGGRFSKQMENITADYNESISFDHKLYKYSIMGSIAHVKMLAQQGIVSEAVSNEIIRGLNIVEQKIDQNEVAFKIIDEDIMMIIEKELIKEIGDTGKYLHTARSRNDQNAVDEILFLREATQNTITHLYDLLEVIIKKAEEEADKIMPGFTHLQHAQPITVGFYYMAHFQGLKRDVERFKETLKRVNVNPLGACAMAGTTLPTDRFITTELLGFREPSENAMDTVGSRDSILEYLFNAALCMTHLSGFAEEIIVFNSQEFNFITIDDSFCTGSSIMPQKKNPDIAELVRGKSGRTIGNLMTMLTVLKGTFLTLNKDYQEDKEALFDSIHTLDRSIFIFARMLENITFNEEVLKSQLKKGFIEATDIAEYLVLNHIPFREAHELVGNLVKYCEMTGKTFPDITKTDLIEVHFPIELDDLSRFSIENCIQNRNSYGGTSPTDVTRQIDNAKTFIRQ